MRLKASRRPTKNIGFLPEHQIAKNSNRDSKTLQMMHTEAKALKQEMQKRHHAANKAIDAFMKDINISKKWGGFTYTGKGPMIKE